LACLRGIEFTFPKNVFRIISQILIKTSVLNNNKKEKFDTKNLNSK
jgi:hypothetical protein